MRITSPRLRRLDNALAWLPADSDAMMISELDGYLAGIVICPETIPSDEWLPAVWGGDGAIFADELEAAWHRALIEEHHLAITRTLDKGAGRYACFLELDAPTGEVMWELWIGGFARALALRPASWERIVESGEVEAVAALSGLRTLVEIASDASNMERADIDQRTQEAPDLIAPWIETLYRWRRTQGSAPLVSSSPATPAKIGRNDPCPCGSGRKSKKCCGVG